MRNLLSIIFLIFSITLIGCKQDSVTKGISFQKDAVIEIVRADGSLVSFDVELADTPEKQTQGLMFRYSMEDNQGMFFLFNSIIPHSFWMKNTYISLDIIFISEDYEILQIHHNTFPLSEEPILSDYPCKYVLEIKGGIAKKQNINPGDIVRLIKE